MWAEMIIKAILKEEKKLCQKKKKDKYVEKGVGTIPPSFLWGY